MSDFWILFSNFIDGVYNFIVRENLNTSYIIISGKIFIMEMRDTEMNEINKEEIFRLIKERRVKFVGGGYKHIISGELDESSL